MIYYRGKEKNIDNYAMTQDGPIYMVDVSKGGPKKSGNVQFFYKVHAHTQGNMTVPSCPP